MARPVLDRRPRQTGREGDRRHVQQQVRRAAERRVHDHRVVDRGLGEDVPQRQAPLRLSDHKARALRRAMSSQIG